MPSSVHKQVSDGEGIYSVNGPDRGCKASTASARHASIATSNNRLTRAPPPPPTHAQPDINHLKTTQQILDLLDEKLQYRRPALAATRLDGNNNSPISHGAETSTAPLRPTGSGRLEESARNHRRRRSHRAALQNLDRYLDCWLECDCGPRINHHRGYANSSRGNLSKSESEIAVTLEGSPESHLFACEGSSWRSCEAASVNCLSASRRQAACCYEPGHRLIIDERCKHCCHSHKPQRRGSNRLSRQPGSTSNRLATRTEWRCNATPKPHFHNPAAAAVSHCYQSSSRRAIPETCPRPEEVGDTESGDEEEKYLATLEARAQFDLASEVGSALEESPDFECEQPTTISGLFGGSLVEAHHDLQLGSCLARGNHYCSAKPASGETSLSCAAPVEFLGKCSNYSSGNTSLIREEQGARCGCCEPRLHQCPPANYGQGGRCDYLYSGTPTRGLGATTRATNYGTPNEPLDFYEAAQLLENDEAANELAASGSCLWDSLNLDELSESDLSLWNLSSISNNGGSMRALKEVAKTSVPSIASLQYLPNRIDSSKRKRPHSITGNTMKPPTTGAEPRVNVSHESLPQGSHLLNRLCLCHCASSKNSNQDEPARKRTSSAAECKSAQPNCLSSSSNSLPQSTGAKQSSPRRTQRDDSDSLLRSTEKQSPAFLNILLKSAAELKNGPFSLKQRTVSPCHHRDEGAGSVFSSRGDISASDSSLTRGLKRRQLRSESSLLLSEQASTSAPRDRRREDANLRPKSACSNAEGARSGGSATRYLSLNRLFNGTKSSKVPKETQSTLPDKPLKGSEEKQRSFLTKSLQRLSYRRRNNKSPQTANPETASSSSSQSHLENSTDQSRKTPSTTGNSPITSAQSQLVAAPEITLNHVEYCDAEHTAKIRSRRTTDSMDLSTGDAESFCNQSPSEIYDCNESTGGGLLVSDTDEGSFSLSSTPNYLHDNHLALNLHPKRSPRLSRSPIPFESPVTQSSKIEDGLKVCSSEHFEKHIDNIKDTQIEAQKRLFKLWINHYCPNLIRSDLVLEFKDGIKLIGLIGSLTRDKQLLSTYSRLNKDRQTYINRIVTTPSSRLRHLSNVSMAIDYLRERVGMKLINLNPMDIVSGKPNVILGLCWNIILNFQLEQNFPLCYHSREQLDSAETNSSLPQDEPRRRYSKQDALCGPDEYTPSYFLNAKKKVLDHINKRFNLKLTTLTSNLINGDVLLTILKQLSPEVACMEVIRGQEGQPWDNMTNDDKLDCCFALAQAHLNIPCLFSAADLRRHHLDHNNFKPLLVYLSMLLSANPSAASSLGPVDSIEPDESERLDINDCVRSYLDDIDTSDKFNLDRLHFTIEKVEKLGEIIRSHKEEPGRLELDSSLIDKHNKLRDQIKQVENLIAWINEADNLMENTSSSAEDLKDSIDKYKDFFSESKIPQMSTEPICPILMRQYRECLSNARQKILSMEQTFKNWNSYETTREELKQWLSLAETKLNEASQFTSQLDETAAPVEHLTSVMQDLINYFELEPIDSIMSEELASGNLDLLVNEDTVSMTGSITSLNSNSSRLSAFQSSSKATSTKLFEEFEIKTRLLATVLEPVQRENLLLAMKQFKRTLKYITKIQVPKVVNEIRWNIIQLNSEAPSDQEPAEHTELGKLEPEVEQVVEQLESPVAEREVLEEVAEDATSIVSPECREEPAKVVKVKASKVKASKREKKVKRSQSPMSAGKKSQDKVAIEEVEEKKKKAWFFSSWLFGYQEPEVDCAAEEKEAKKSAKCNQKHSKDAKIVKTTQPSYPQLYWSKLVRAYKTSLPLTVVLLICLAGVCVVPLINKNLCCDFKLDHIPQENLDIGEKPT